MLKNTRQTTQYCHWFGQACHGLVKAAVQYPAQVLVALGAVTMGFSVVQATTTGVTDPEENSSGVTLIRPVSDQVAKTSEPYDVTLKPQNYLDSANRYQRFDVQGVDGTELPSWLTVTKSAELEEIIHIEVEDTFNNADAEGDLLFVAAGKAGIKVYNISDERQPQLTSIIATPGNAMGVDVQLPYLYVADGPEGFQVWDLTEGLFPKSYISQIKGIWTARDVRVNNTIAYVAAETAGVRMINTENLARPIELAPYTRTATARSLCFYEGYILLADGVNGLGVLQADASELSEVHRHQHASWQRIDWVGIDGAMIHVSDGVVKSNIRFSKHLLFEHMGIAASRLMPMVVTTAGNGLIYVEDQQYYWQPRYEQVWDLATFSQLSLSKTINYILDAQNNPKEFISPYQIYKHNDLLYLHLLTVHRSGKDRLLVIDLDEHYNPTILSNFELNDSYQSVAIISDYVALVSGWDSEATIWDIGNNSAVQQMPCRHCAVDLELSGLFYEGGFVYGISEKFGFCVLNVSDWHQPEQVGCADYSIPYFHSDSRPMAIIKNQVYIANFHFGSIRQFNVADPTQPSEQQTLSWIGHAFDVKARNNVLYVLDRVGLYIIDVSTPSQPRNVSSWTLPTTKKNLNNLELHRDIAIAQLGSWELLGSGELLFIDISLARTPVELARVQFNYQSADHIVDQGLLYLSGYDETFDKSVLQIMDVRKLQNKVEEFGYLEPPGQARAIAIQGNVLFLASRLEGMHIIDISNPGDLKLLAHVDTPGRALGITAASELVYVADFDHNVSVFNITQPHSPKLVGRIETVGEAMITVIEEDIAYIGDYAGGLRILNVSHPTMVERLSDLALPSQIMGMELVGETLFVAAWNYGLRIINVADKRRPFEVGFYDTPGYAWMVTVAGHLAYIADHYSLEIVDVFNLTHPIGVASVGSVTPIFATVQAQKAYLACYDQGIAILDVANLVNVTVVAAYPTPGIAYAIHLKGGFAYVANWLSGLRVLNIETIQRRVFGELASRIINFADGYLVQLNSHTLGHYDSRAELSAVYSHVQANLVCQLASVFNTLSFNFSLDIFRPAVQQLAFSEDKLVTLAYHRIISVYRIYQQQLVLEYELVRNEYSFDHVGLFGDLLVFSDYADTNLHLRNASVAAEDLGQYTHIQLSERVTALAFDADQLYVGTQNGLIQIFNVAKPSTPMLVGFWESILAPLKQPITKLFVNQQLIFSAIGQHLVLIDAINLQQRPPILLHDYDAGSTVEDFVVQDNRIALVLGNRGIKILLNKNNAQQWSNQIRLSGTRPALDKSIYSLELISSDVNAQTTKTPPFSLNYQHPPVVIAEISGREFNVFDTISIQLKTEFIFTDADNDLLSLSIASLPSWLAFDAQSTRLSGEVPRNTQGSYELIVIADDSQGGQARTNFELRVLNRAPVLPTLRDTQVMIGERYEKSYSNVLFDPDHDALTAMLTLSNQPLPHWVQWNLTSGLLTIEPPVGSQGDYTLDLRVEDPFGGFDENQLTIAVPNRTPILPNLRDVEVVVGGRYQQFYLELLSDPDGDVLHATLSISGQALPNWVSWNITSGLLTIEPPIGSQGEYNLGITVEDPFGLSTSRSLVLTVPNRPPEIASVNNVEVVIGDHYREQFETTLVNDPDDDPLTTNLQLNTGEPLPSWLQLDLHNNTLKVEPIPGSQGSYRVRLRAQDPFGESSQSQFTVIIPNRAPQFVQPLREQRARLNQPFSFTLPTEVAEDRDGDDVQFSADIPNGLSWLSFNSSSLELTGRATQLTSASETIVLTASDGELSAITELRLSVVGSLAVTLRDEQTALTYTEEQTMQLPVLQIVTPAKSASVVFSFSDRLAGVLATSSGQLANPLPGRFELPPQAVNNLNQQLNNITLVPSKDYNRDVTIRVVVNDGGLNLPETLEWFIAGNNINDIPQLAKPIGILAAVEEERFDFLIPADTFSDADGDALTYSVTGIGHGDLPGGFKFNAETTTLSGIPTAAGELGFEVRAQDRVSESLPHLFQVKVASADSLVNKEDLIALLPVGLTVTLILVALSCYQRGRIKLKRLQALLEKIDLTPLFASLQNRRVNQAELGRLVVLLQQTYMGQTDHASLVQLLPQFSDLSLLLGKTDPIFSPVGHSGYLHLIKLYLLPAVRNEVAAFSKKATVKRRYSTNLLLQVSYLVAFFEIMLLLDSRQGRPINELERLDLLLMVHYSIRNLKSNIQHYPLLKLHLLRARAALSSVRDTDTLMKFVMRVPGRVMSTLVGFVRFNARQWYVDILKLKYQLVYEVQDQHSPAWNVFKQSQQRYLKQPLVLSGYIEAMQIMYQRSDDNVLRELILRGSGHRVEQEFLGLEQLMKHSDAMIREQASWVKNQLASAGANESITVNIDTNYTVDEAKEGSAQLHTNPLAIAERYQRRLGLVGLFSPARTPVDTAKSKYSLTKRALTKSTIQYNPTLSGSGSDLSWQQNPINESRRVSKARLFEVSGKIAQAKARALPTEVPQFYRQKPSRP